MRLFFLIVFTTIILKGNSNYILKIVNSSPMLLSCWQLSRGGKSLGTRSCGIFIQVTENGFLIVSSCFQVVVSGIGSKPVKALTIELSVKSCPVGPELQPSFDASSAPGCCPQRHEILVNQDIKY
jgi:hypothetical protein